MTTTLDLDTQRLRLRLIRSAEDLTPLPAAVAKLANVLQDAESGPDEVADVVRQDPVLTASLLREANSSYVAANTEIATVERAFMLLGRARLLMLAVKGHVNEQFQPALPQYGLVKGELWQHSVVSATAAGVLRDKATYAPGGEAITAALLHDLAKLVLCDYLDLRELADEYSGVPIPDLERHIVSIDHAELGGIITAKWGLPGSISDAIAYHHQPVSAGEPLAAHAVWVADAIAHEVLADPHGAEPYFDLLRATVSPSLDALGILEREWDDLVRTTQKAILATR